MSRSPYVVCTSESANRLKFVASCMNLRLHYIIETKLKRLPPMLPGSSYPMKLKGLLYDQIRSGKSKMKANKPEVPISKPVDMIGTRF